MAYCDAEKSFAAQSLSYLCYQPWCFWLAAVKRERKRRYIGIYNYSWPEQLAKFRDKIMTWAVWWSFSSPFALSASFRLIPPHLLRLPRPLYRSLHSWISFSPDTRTIPHFFSYLHSLICAHFFMQSKSNWPDRWILLANQAESACRSVSRETTVTVGCLNGFSWLLIGFLCPAIMNEVSNCESSSRFCFNRPLKIE